ncbi:MAG: hypothetical protein ABI543_06500 [Ignavibacteria bacterium]
MTKSVKIVFLSIIALFLVYLGYSVYTSSQADTVTFSKFDINSTASKMIKVEILKEKGITPNSEGGVTFYAKDKDGVEKKISLGKEFPAGNDIPKSVTLTGHLHADHFHATEAEFD